MSDWLCKFLPWHFWCSSPKTALPHSLSHTCWRHTWQKWVECRQGCVFFVLAKHVALFATPKPDWRGEKEFKQTALSAELKLSPAVPGLHLLIHCNTLCKVFFICIFFNLIYTVSHIIFNSTASSQVSYIFSWVLVCLSLSCLCFKRCPCNQCWLQICNVALN